MGMLSERQKRELEFYEQFSQRNISPIVSFASITGKKARPGNSYWHVISVVKQNFRSGNQKLLDFGCGKGDCSVIFSRIGYKVFGFDLSPNNVAIAKRLAQQYGVTERTHFQVGVAEELDYPSDFFEAIARHGRVRQLPRRPPVKSPAYRIATFVEDSRFVTRHQLHSCHLRLGSRVREFQVIVDDEWPSMSRLTVSVTPHSAALC